jgi:hypothetical protein
MLEKVGRGENAKEDFLKPCQRRYLIQKITTIKKLTGLLQKRRMGRKV